MVDQIKLPDSLTLQRLVLAGVLACGVGQTHSAVAQGRMPAGPGGGQPMNVIRQQPLTGWPFTVSPWLRSGGQISGLTTPMDMDHFRSNTDFGLSRATGNGRYSGPNLQTHYAPTGLEIRQDAWNPFISVNPFGFPLQLESPAVTTVTPRQTGRSVYNVQTSNSPLVATSPAGGSPIRPDRVPNLPTRPMLVLPGNGWTIYFPYGQAYYPLYRHEFIYGATAASPYYYYGSFPPYIGSSDLYYLPPQYVFVPYPVYSDDGQYVGDQNQVDTGITNVPAVAPAAPQEQAPAEYKVKETTRKTDELLDTAVTDLSSTWKNADINALAKHIRKDSRIAVYLRGKYQYSVDSGDYLDMTRDALRSTKTVKFTIDSVDFKQKGVYTIVGKHTYSDAVGKNHMVRVSYVLEKVEDEYYITQVGTAPEKLE